MGGASSDLAPDLGLPAGIAAASDDEDEETVILRRLAPEAVLPILRIAPARDDTPLSVMLARDREAARDWIDRVATTFFTLAVEGHLLPAALRADQVLVDAGGGIRFLIGPLPLILPAATHAELPALLSALAMGDRTELAASTARASAPPTKHKEAVHLLSAALDPLPPDEPALWCATLGALLLSEGTLGALFVRLAELAELAELAPADERADWFPTALSEGATAARVEALRQAIHPERILPSLIAALRLGRELPDQLRSIFDQLADGHLPFRIDWRLDPEMARRDHIDNRLIFLALLSVSLALLTAAIWVRGGSGWAVLLPGLPLLMTYGAIGLLWMRGR